MNRRLLALNLALAVLVALAGWQTWERLEQAREREQAIAGRPLEPAAAVPTPEVRPPEPAVAARYFPVADNLLFFPDRNPVVVIDAAPPKPMPPLPVAHGILDIGAGPTVILSENATAPQRGYQAGESYKDFKIVQVTANGVVFEWEGKQIARSLEQLKPAQQAPALPATTTAAAKPARPKPQAQTLGEDVKPGPSDIDFGEGMKACKPGDKSPSGTVVGRYRKVLTQTPFGGACRWVLIE